MTGKSTRWIARRLVQLVLLAVLAAVAVAVAVLIVIPRAVHGQALTVLTGSMTPEIAVGSVVVIRPVDPNTLRVGDVITYQRSPAQNDYVTHRILAIHVETAPATLTMKGDANRAEDVKPVAVTNVRGKVLFSVPYLGSIREAISVRGGGLLLLMLGLFGYGVAQVGSVLRDRRKSKASTEAPEAASPSPASDAAPTDDAAGRLQLLVVTLPRSALAGGSGEDVAQLLRADLIAQGGETFTISLARTPEQLDILTQLLGSFSPSSVVRSDIVSVSPQSHRGSRPAGDEDTFSAWPADVASPDAARLSSQTPVPAGS
jgi:signal peptidase